MGWSCWCDLSSIQSNIATDFRWCDITCLQSGKSKLLALKSNDWCWKCTEHVHVSYVSCESELFADKPGILAHLSGLFSDVSSVLANFAGWCKRSSSRCRWPQVLANFSSVFTYVTTVFAYFPSVFSDVAAILAYTVSYTHLTLPTNREV